MALVETWELVFYILIGLSFCSFIVTRVIDLHIIGTNWRFPEYLFILSGILAVVGFGVSFFTRGINLVFAGIIVLDIILYPIVEDFLG